MRAKIILISAGIVLVSLVYAAVPTEKEEFHTIPYEIQEGDTIYGIAEKFATPTENINKKTYEIRVKNNLNSANIEPGKVIYVEVKDK